MSIQKIRVHIQRPVPAYPIPPVAKRVFAGKIFDVYQWEQQLFDGTTTLFEKLKRPDTALVVSATTEGKILLCEQEQPGRKPYIGVLGGRVDEGEDPLSAAKRELLEESGYEASDWQLWDAVYPHSKIDWVVYTFIARGCRKVGEQKLDAGEKIALKLATLDEFIDAVLTPYFGDPHLRVKVIEAKADSRARERLRKLLFDT